MYFRFENLIDNKLQRLIYIAMLIILLLTLIF